MKESYYIKVIYQTPSPKTINKINPHLIISINRLLLVISLLCVKVEEFQLIGNLACGDDMEVVTKIVKLQKPLREVFQIPKDAKTTTIHPPLREGNR